MSKSLTVSTLVLKELVGKAVKACSMVPEILETTVVEIKLENGTLSVTGTDTNNYVTLFKDQIEGEDFRVSAGAKLLSQLISKITTANTKLTIMDNKLVIEGNGKYSVELKVDEFGNTVLFNDLPFDSTVAKNQISNDDIKSILTVNKSCKSDMKESAVLYNYYMDSERVLTTDLYKACMNPISLFNTPVCLPTRLVDLIPLVADESGVSVQLSGDTVLFSSSKGKLYGRTCSAEDVLDYPAEGLVKVLSEQMEYSARVSKSTLSTAFDRITLMADSYGSNVIILTFKETGVELSSVRAQSNEVVSYVAPVENVPAFEIKVESGFLKSALSSHVSEDLTVNFGSESGIQLVGNDVVVSISAVEE